MNISITQIDQNRLSIHAFRIFLELRECVYDPEFMKRFEEWKAARDEEAAVLNKGEATK